MRRTAITFVLSISLAACGPEIGDDCNDSLDCSIDGTRFCDHTQPDGYCLIVGCRADECPEEAVCVQFGCDEQARTFCLRHCENNGDCRGGYECVEPDDNDGICSATNSDAIYSDIVDDAPNGHKYCIERS